MPLSHVRPTGHEDSTSLENLLIREAVRERMFGAKPAPLRIGEYRLLRRVGAGGMGEVYLAHDDALDRPVAIKLVHARFAREQRFAERMQREARSLAKLTHPNVVRVYEFGEHEGRYYLAMEYVAGQSLGAWIHDHRPSWTLVLDAYLAAGEGLAAAHAVGLVHRDFKPDNVLRGDDGRVCVADFGLARAGASVGEFTGESGEAPSTLDERLSATGTVMGTLAYMPLEQLRGGVVDARSDQFAFGVALYVGLWGRPPFVAASPGERELVLAADPTPPPASPVPSWVWPIVRRALARDPDDRWPDMPALLDALRATPLRRRARRRSAALLIGVPLAFGIGWARLAAHAPAPDPCVVDERSLAGTWDAERRDALRRSFAASGSALAPEATARVEATLDAWSASWLVELRSSCEATRVQGVQSDAMLDRRTRCLGGQRREVEALLDALAQADVGVVVRSGKALAGLPELGACSVEALAATPEPALAPDARTALEAGEDSLARARVSLELGQIERASELAASARERGEALDHLPLTLEARALQAKLTLRRGELEAGVTALRELVQAAELAGLAELAASFRVALARAAAGELADLRLEGWLIDEAQLALARVGRARDPREIQLAVARARVAEHAGDLAGASASYASAFELAHDRLDPAQLALLHFDYGNLLYGMGELDAARRELEGALLVLRDAWGPNAPEAGRIEFNLGVITTDLGEFELAERHFDAAIAIDERAWGRDSIEVARDRYARHYLAFARNDIAAACRLIDASLPVYEAELGPDHDETAEVVNAAAICRYFEDDFDAAIALYRRAMAIQVAALGEDHPALVDLHANLGVARLALGQLDEALGEFDRALTIAAAKLPADHPSLALPTLGRAQVWQARGDHARALPELERVLASQTLQGIDLAELRFALAQALIHVHGERERARANELAGLALAAFERAGLERLARRPRDWLAEAPP